MKRLVLVDGNNLLFRSYFATAYTGNIMRNSKGFPTNAIYGFIAMINNVLEKEKPEYMLVAFDKGKSFRHREYKDYKAGRNETPNELIVQMPYARKVLEYMGIKHFEIDDYEADDIIGTAVKMALDDKEFITRMVSSDRDLLQLMNYETDMKLLKAKEIRIYDVETYKEEFGIDPINVIDLKALEGDKSDNIPGVRGIGEKTALTLIQKFGSLEGIYENLDQIKGATHQKLETDKEMAFFSKKLATIYQDVPLPFTLEDCKIINEDNEKLEELFKELEFRSLLKKRALIKKDDSELVIDKKNKITNLKDAAIYIECSSLNYHIGDILGVGIYDGEKSYYLTKEEFLDNKDIIDNLKYTYDLKKNNVLLNKYNLKLNCEYDLMITSYLLETSLNDDISSLMIENGYEVLPTEELLKNKELSKEELEKQIVLKAKYIYDGRIHNLELLEKEDLMTLYNELEFPLIEVLTDMEIEGIRISKEELETSRIDLLAKQKKSKEEIFNASGHEFNIASTKQLGVVLYEELGLPTLGRKGSKHGYSTSHEVLMKLKNTNHTNAFIIEPIVNYRNYTKLLNTYVDAIPNFIQEDNKIHTIYKQTITRTGRLSSVEPNLQNIPVRSEVGKELRKVFIPEKGCFLLSSDYSQIELRVLAHISEDKNLIDAFVNDEDIHTRVASDIYGVSKEEVSKDMRRTAKAVIFGIVYGISSFGLSENLGISPSEAKVLIDKYLSLYPSVKDYMTNIVESARKDYTVRTIFNRKRTIEELASSNFNKRQSGERIALNTPIQGSSADIIKKAMIDVYKELKKRNLKSKMLLQIHDELVFNVYEEELEEVKELVKNTMENAYKLLVPLKVEMEYGINMFEAK